tara:strand:- start:1507 stop:1770 length:264 start_codon:yes stop_codon:yes gene_type:complete
MNNVVAPALLKALHKKYEADLEVAFAECIIYLANSSGIGEHSEIVVEVDKKIQAMHDAIGKKEILDTYFKAKPEIPTKEKNDKKPAS